MGASPEVGKSPDDSFIRGYCQLQDHACEALAGQPQCQSRDPDGTMSFGAGAESVGDGAEQPCNNGEYNAANYGKLHSVHAESITGSHGDQTEGCT